MNNIQDEMLNISCMIRDEITNLFNENMLKNSNVDKTLYRLFMFFSERSQTIVHLVSHRYVWDAEIILRSLYETASKIWFICLRKDRDEIVNEFWGINLKINNRKRDLHAQKVLRLYETTSKNSNIGNKMFECFSDKNKFAHDDLNRNV